MKNKKIFILPFFGKLPEWMPKWRKNMKATNKILLIRTWSGELPEWYDKWTKQMDKLKKYGFDYLVVDGEETRKRVKDILDIDINFKEHYRCISDFDPTLGLLFEKKMRGYDYWGHINLDAIYGRLDRYMTSEFLSDCEIYGNDPDAICGPFSLYKNIPKINNLFYNVRGWKEILSDTKLRAFDELHMTNLLRVMPDIKFKSGFLQENDKQICHSPIPKIKLLDDGTLLNSETGKEMMMFHFNRTRKWIF